MLPLLGMLGSKQLFRINLPFAILASSLVGVSARAEVGEQDTPLVLPSRRDDLAWEAFERQDYATAYRLWLPMAEGGDETAQFRLGWLFRNGRGVSRDQAIAFNWFNKAAVQGHASAQNNLGVMYRTGEGTSKDEAAATHWFRKAAEQGLAAAQYNLAFSYYHGEGVAQDLQEAAKWYKKAAEQGHAAAQNSLGLMYYRGEGGPLDRVQAHLWFTLAVSSTLDDEIRADAAWNLALVRLNMSEAEIAEAEKLATDWKPVRS